MLDVHRRRDTVTLVEQRREGSPAPPAILALSRLIGLVARQQCPDNPSILVRDGGVSKVEMVTLTALIYSVLFPSISTFETPPHL